MAQLIKDRDNFGVTFADPSKPLDTTRVKHENSTKRIQGIVVDSNTLEVIGLRQAPVGTDVNETLSVRIKVIGSTANAAMAKDLANDVMQATTTWLTENAFVGFDPQTAPSYN